MCHDSTLNTHDTTLDWRISNHVFTRHQSGFRSTCRIRPTDIGRIFGGYDLLSLSVSLSYYIHSNLLFGKPLFVRSGVDYTDHSQYVVPYETKLSASQRASAYVSIVGAAHGFQVA